jgi:NAD(P)-dependent dehydrogenase (short-subunit alcohol dehydrogenase family)
LHKTSLKAKSGTLTAEEREQHFLNLVAQNILMGRAAADELKGLAVFLASDASSFVTGSALVQDGGQTAKI